MRQYVRGHQAVRNPSTEYIEARAIDLPEEQPRFSTPPIPNDNRARDDPEQPEDQRLFNAVTKGNLDALRLLTSSGWSVDTTFYHMRENQPLVAIAIYSRHETMGM